MIALVASAALALLPQGYEIFTADTERSVVSADRTAVAAADALRSLGNTMGWRVNFATKRLEGELAMVSLDLSFDELNPRTVAQLVAATGDADAVFDDGWEGSGPDVLHIVSQASAETEPGRRRLMRRSMEWYETFLSDDLRLEPIVSENSMEVRMHLGKMLLEQGELEAAIELFEQVHNEDESHAYVPLALLRLAQSHQDLGNYELAEKWAREVSRMHPSRPETAAATVLLGHNLIDQGRYDECVATMRAAILPLANTPEVIDILLITAEAHTHRDRPDHVLEQMRLLADSHNFRDLSEPQWLDYHYLRGLGAEGVGEYEEALEMLEIFLATGPADSRRGPALVLLGRTYLALDSFVEARAAALQALTYQSAMDDSWRKEARILQAKTALSLGQKDQAFTDLEREVRRDPVQTPELIVFLIESFIEDQRYQKAIASSELLTSTSGKWGDKARYLKILAMWKQNPRAELLDNFLTQARVLAPQIIDEDLQRKAAQIVGQAYGLRGDWEKAVNAYHGVLQ